jgi:hypothetical protein
VLLLSVIVFVITFADIGEPIAAGLDPSYKFAFNYFFANNLQIAKTVLFTYGPLGFLLFPQDQGNNLIWAIIIISLLRFVFIVNFFYLYKIIKEKKDTWSLIVIASVAYIVSSIISTHDLLIFIPLLLLTTHSIKHNLLLIMLSCVVISAALLIKSSAGIVSLLLLASYMMYLLFKKDYKVVTTIFFSISISFLCFWFFLYHDLFGMYDYFFAILELSKGNSSAMTINPDNNWWIFGLFILFFLSYPLMKKEKVIIILYGITFLPSAAYFKFAMSREDHIHYYVDFLFILLSIIFLTTKRVGFKEILHLFLIFICFLYVSPYIQKIIYFHQPSLNILEIFDVKDKYNELHKQSEMNLKPFQLDPATRKMISSHAVDTYPWDVSYIAANSLNWKPRPVFQSYITYTEFLDHSNTNFFKSKNAPEYIIWQLKPCNSSMDGRYLLNDEPSTLYEILNKYTVVSRNSDYLVLKRHNDELLSSRIVSENTYQWDQWISIPTVAAGNSRSTFVLADTDIKRTIVQSLKKLIYKEFEVYIEYKFKDNTVQRYRLVVDTAKDGIWVSPLLDNLFLFPASKQVVAIKLTHNKKDYFKDTFAIRWKIVSSKTPLFIVYEK